MNLLRSIALTAMMTAALGAIATPPANYYTKAENKNQRNLLEALSSIISSHTTLSYNSLNDYYPKTDAYPDGTLWDIYSTKHWNPSSKCGNYSKVGDCYNKEHSFPKSWFGGSSPMYSDIMHLYPTDGKVNGQRSNYPYGECAGGTNLGTNAGVRALGRLGTSTFSGYTGTVFEPDDEYKGDLARTYFYMAACYYSRTASWSSDMLAGNNYPLFKPWAINLLLKWHRQDPVSDRETTRNEEIYKIQHNRNPFIDHPELAEYIWGNRTEQYWTAAGTADPEITIPVSGSSIDIGVTAAGIEISKSVSIRTVAATEAVVISATAPFSVSATSVTAAQANAGTSVKVSYVPSQVGNHSGTLTISTGKAVSTVSLSGRCVDGVPAAEATYITDDSFVANWTYIGDADSQGRYTLTVSDDEGVLDGYPRAVDAQTGHYTVDGLMPQTDYYYTVASESRVSSTIAVTTGAPIPSIDFLFDGDLFLTAVPGEPSEVAELIMDISNITGTITVTVEAPFQISIDRSAWSTTLRMSPDEDRIYLRLYSDLAGTFQTSIVATAGDYYTDDAEVSGEVSSMQTFLEDFENYEKKYETYSDQTYVGTACTWALKDAGMWAADNEAHSGEHSIRCGKTAASTVEMTADRHKGIGTISFVVMKWTDKEADATVAVETSTDGGASWKLAGTVTVDNATTWTEYHVAANVAGTARMRLRQTAGARFFVDDIGLTDRTSGVDDPRADRHQWDAFSHSGEIYVTVTAPEGIDAAIYSVDGTTIYSGHLAEGTHTFDTVAPGTVVIVHRGDFSRTLMVR